MILPEEIAEFPFFAAMSPEMRLRIASRSADIRVNANEWIAREGDAPYLWTLMSGEVEMVKRFGGQTQQVTTFDPGEYFGEVELMIGADALSDVRATVASRLMRLDPADFHLMMTASDECSSILAQGLVRRVNFRRDVYAAANVTQVAIVGDRYNLACHDLRDFLSRNQVAYEWLDPSDPADAAVMPSDSADPASHPLAVFANGKRMAAPTRRELAEGLDLQTVPRNASYDVAIVGGGPAGLAAAVYGGSEGLKTIMIEREAPGGQAGTSSRVENYLGFSGGISGSDLSSRALLQAKRFGTEILVTRAVRSIESTPNGHTIELDGGDRIEARTIVIATGVTWRQLACTGAEDLVGRGVYYGAARTEGLGTRGKDVFLIGGGNSAGQAAMFFSSYASSVTLLVRGPSLEKGMSQYLIEQLATKANIHVEVDTTVVAVSGNGRIEAITTRVESTGETRERPADALFVFIGADAATGWMPEGLERDPRGYLRTGRDIVGWHNERLPFPLETSIPGIFAAGDVRSQSVKRVASSVGEGSMVIAFIHEYLAAADAAAARAATGARQ